jgi:hypothetical protein
MELARNLLFTFLFISVLTLTQCKKDDDPTPNELLIGIWQAVEIDGEVAPPDEIITFEFEPNQDFEWCYTYENDHYCYYGEWNWLGTNYDKINLEISDEDGYEYSFNLEIERLDESHLDVELYNELVKFIKL